MTFPGHGLLHPAGIGVADMPPGLFPYPTPHWARLTRAAEPYIAAGYSDDEAWSAFFVDDDGLERRTDSRGEVLPWNVIVAQAVHGNRPSRRRRPVRHQPAIYGGGPSRRPPKPPTQRRLFPDDD